MRKNKKSMSRERGLGLKILRVVGLGILLGAVSIIAPQFPYATLQAALKKKFGKNYSSARLINSTNYLKRKKFIAYSNGNYTITPMGRKWLTRAEALELKIPRQNWDGRWRLVSFDIPEAQKTARHLFSRKLKKLGFYNFQRSLFLIPYPCEKELAILTNSFKIAPHVHIFTADHFANDKKLRKIFGV
ncbi:MAG: hypothetical protein M1275_01105 [Patescibacteria group bacterium]|nr:hypothetical protein [Patescibacteria group bacterium]